MAGRQLIFQPPKFNWHAEDQQLVFDEWKGQIILTLWASSIKKDIWFATIIGYLGKEGFKRWHMLPISRDEEAQKDPETVFKAIAEHPWSLNLILDLQWYKTRRQWVNQPTWPADQELSRKMSVQRCQYTTDEKLVRRTELLFHMTKHFEVKKWVRSKKNQEDVKYPALLQYAKEQWDDGERFQLSQV